MGILLKSSQYTDIYGNITSDFKANAGDVITCEHTFESEIGCMSTDQNVINVLKLENKVTRTKGSFIEDGFRVGDTYYMKVVDGVNTLTATHTGTISEIGDLYFVATGLPSVNNVSSATSGNIIYIYTEAQFDVLDFGFNFIDNNNPNTTLESFIDQETSRFLLSNISSMIVTDVLTPTQIGKKSGQFAVSNLSFERLADVSNPYSAFTTTRQQYKLTFTLIFSGLFDEDFFKGNNCLRYYFQGKFKRSANENYAPNKFEVNENSNTGFFDEGYNTENPISTDTVSVSEIYYNQVTNLNFSFTIDNTAISQIEIGGCYITLDDSYNYNKKESQSDLLPILHTGLIDATDIGNDWDSTTDFRFNLLLNDFSYIDAGGKRTFTIDVDINPFYTSVGSFGKFIESRGELERNFLFWVKVGNVNKLLYNAPLEYKMPVGVAFTPDYEYLVNHDENTDFSDISLTPIGSNDDFNTEDDIDYIIGIPLNSSDENQSIKVSMVIRDTVTLDEFTLESVSFDLTQQNLTYFKDTFLNITNNLPDSSNKKQAYLVEETALSGGVIHLRLGYPFLIRWEGWIEQLESLPYFNANGLNTQDWYNYIVGNTKLFVKTEIGRNGVFDYNYKQVTFVDYDSWSGTSTIELYDETETTSYNILKYGTKMLIKATHVFSGAYGLYPWGMITIEPKESQPRFILSTEIDRTQSNNPLKGISNPDRCDIEFYDATTIILRCYVDTNMLSGGNFCISSKISEEGQNNNFVVAPKITEAGIDKLLEDGTETKITE